MKNEKELEINFKDLHLHKAVIQAVDRVGYETPSTIQAQMIPHMLAGKDVIGQAQTGTGKTAAFALPLLSKLDLNSVQPQVLVLTPTRELAIQVSEAFQKYAYFLKGFHVLPIYGGQAYDGQLKRLKRGVHVVVGTPGRVMDHMRRKTLKLESLRCLVLDEADEMLRMGFIADVEWIVEKTPENRQIALFSATMPSAIRKIAQKYLHDPVQITIQKKTMTVESTRQRYWMVSGMHKLDALTRILEVEPYDGVIVFVRTKNATIEIAEKLEARGYSVVAINGDITQNKREKAIESIRKGKFNILVATDVAARGLDVDRISHVINYDIPYDPEAYIHRIGRTGRMGNPGEAILFVQPRERSMLRAIEEATRQKIELMDLPSAEMVNDKRIAQFKQKIIDTLSEPSLEIYKNLVVELQQEYNVPAEEIAAALAKMVQGDEPLLLRSKIKKQKKQIKTETITQKRENIKKEQPLLEPGMERFRIEVGERHGVKPGNIVGAIANEAEIEANYIGKIQIFNEYSLVDLPEGMPKQVFYDLKKVWVAGQQLMISRLDLPREQTRFRKRKPRSMKRTEEQRRRKK